MANGQVNPKLHKDLLLACGWGKEIDVVLLLQQGASVKVQDQNGRNCLHYAASKGHTNIVEILLLKKCNANAKDKYGSTPLHQSAVNGHTECASILIEGGSEVNFQDDNGNTPLYEAVWNNQPDTVDLLLNNEADVNIRNKEAYTPLHLACQNNNGKIIQNLVKWGANLQSPTSTGNTPLHIAIQNSKVDAVKTLLGLDADINLQNHDGDTPLHLCAELGDKKITTLILECGQPYEASLNNVGDSPKDIAVQLGNKDVADMIPTPMVGRKQQKKNSDVPGSPKRTQKQRTANKSKHVTPTDDKMKTDSLERPVRVVVQPASVDNLLATDTCSSLSSLWLPVPDANESLPVDVHWQKSLSPCPERKARNFDNITDLAALKEIKRSDQHSQSDASSIKSPRYQIRKKRRKYVTGHVSSKQKVQDDDWEEVIDEKEKETKRVKDPKASKNDVEKNVGQIIEYPCYPSGMMLAVESGSDDWSTLFKKKKKNSSRKLKKVDEQREEEENSIPSPISQNKSDITSGLASPRVRGRAELKAEFADKSIGNGEQNGDVPMEQKFNEDQKQYTKGLREYLKTSLVSRRSPANTDEGSSSKTGTLEHKRGKEGRIVQAAELKEHMRLTERDIDALLKKDFLENTTVNGVPQLKSVDRKSSRKTKKKVREPDNDGDDIVVIRLDPKLELPKKAKRTKERKALDNGGKEGYDSIRREKKEAKSSKGGHVDGSFEGGTLRREGGEKRGDKTKMDGSKTLERKEKKVEHKEWPKFEVVLDESCGVEPGPSGKTTPHDRSHNQGAEKSQRHHNHHNHHEQRRKTPDRPSNEATIEMIHKLEKRFRNFLQLTTEKLDEQRECDNKHYSDLKNDISSMERNLERTARNSAVEMIENVTKELDTTMRKWAKVLRGMKFEERKEVSSSAASSTFDIVCEEEGKVVTKAIVQRSHHDAETAPSDVVISSTPIRGSKTGKENGFVVCEDAADKVTRILDEEPVQTLVNGRTDVGNGLDHDDSFDVRREGRAAPQGRSDESSPCLQNRFPGDGDHMSLEKWYQTQLNETEERWRIKAEADQKALRNRIKELEDALFEFTGTHNTMV